MRRKGSTRTCGPMTKELRTGLTSLIAERLSISLCWGKDE
jgi:hypothetical protein